MVLLENFMRLSSSFLDINTNSLLFTIGLSWSIYILLMFLEIRRKRHLGAVLGSACGIRPTPNGRSEGVRPGHPRYTRSSFGLLPYRS